jgi:hypothetical protein
VPPTELAVAEDSAPQDVTAPESETQEAEGPSEDGQPKRKRSRRGSRGGRKRRKPAAAGEESASEGEGIAVADLPDEGEPEYVPMSEWIDDFEARSRR